MMRSFCFLLVYSLFLATRASVVPSGEPQRKTTRKRAVFINEIHYDNIDADVGEFVEVAYPTGTDISRYKLALYRGDKGKEYNIVSLATATVGSSSKGLSFCYVEISGIRDGNNMGDGIALVDPSGTVMQFLSYESTFTAVNGAAKGMTSVGIGVKQPTSTKIGFSLQLGGRGCFYSDFEWQSTPIKDTRGSVNAGQSISCLSRVGVFDYIEPTAEIPNLLGLCQGDCHRDKECHLGLSCFERKIENNRVPGCIGSPVSSKDYCYAPEEGILVRVAVGGLPESAFPLGMCQGGCEKDKDCQKGLSCFIREEKLEPVPGCRAAGNVEGISWTNYCYNATLVEPTRVSPTSAPRSPTNKKRTSLGIPKALNYTGICTSTSPCGRCEGSCASKEENCRSDIGLECFSRRGNEPVVGCVTGGPGDVSGADYCYKAPTKGPVTYIPGELTVVQNGLLLSTGLTSRIIATQDIPVQYDTPVGTQSEEDFHDKPDGAAVFEDPETGGWLYVSNSETMNSGGVGAITFNAKGEVVGYKRLFPEGLTRRNCGGGKTFWNTWITCEELPGGQVWEVDPWGRKPPRKTLIGGEVGDEFESAAYDNRNPRNVTFYITADRDDGPVYKFTPDYRAVTYALSSDPPNYRHLLHTNQTGSAKVEYLVISPDKSLPDEGTFDWTNDLKTAEASASKHYKSPEGIDIRDGVVYFTCKTQRRLFMLDLDRGTYQSQSTESGAFDNRPDQVARIVGDDNAILYFCEDEVDGLSGVHGRDSLGNFYTILENDGSVLSGETSGLAFSPDNSHMYLSYQQPGIIFDITRTDGYSFAGQRLDIKYHAPESVFSSRP